MICCPSWEFKLNESELSQMVVRTVEQPLQAQGSCPQYCCWELGYFNDLRQSLLCFFSFKAESDIFIRGSFSESDRFGPKNKMKGILEFVV